MLLKIFVSFLILLGFLKCLFYGIYEMNQNNKASGISVIILSIITLILPIVIIFIY